MGCMDVGSFKERHGMAGTAPLARPGWHVTMHILGMAGMIILARIFVLAQHGMVWHVATLIYVYIPYRSFAFKASYC